MFDFLNPYLSAIKVGALAVLIGLIAFCGYRVEKWHTDSLRVASVEAEAKRTTEQASQALQIQAKQLRASYEASEGYQREIETLHSTSVVIPAVRVCVPTPRLPPASPASSRPDATPPASGVVPAETSGDPGVNIGPDLAELADRGDRCSAQLRALQGWVRATR